MKSKGITLIALIITIIVLLILAGVSIAFLTGDNGILNKAQSAKTDTEISQAKEYLQLRITNLQTNQLSDNNKSATIQDVFSDYITDTNIQVLIAKQYKIIQ